MDIHAPIRAFLQQQTIISLPLREGVGGGVDNNTPPSPTLPLKGGGNFITKAGIVPFLRKPLRFYLMKPVARHADLPPPKFQIGKGTRMAKAGGVWKDIASLPPVDAEMETLAETALREGVEELGLVLGNIRKLFDLGPYAFSSTKSGKKKQMWLFAAEMASEEFSHEVAASTAACVWMDVEEFGIVGREDHSYILEDIAARLKA